MNDQISYILDENPPYGVYVAINDNGRLHYEELALIPSDKMTLEEAKAFVERLNEARDRCIYQEALCAG